MEHFSIISLNLWNTEYWEQRKACVASFVSSYDADIYCFQEVRPQSLELVDSILQGHKRVAGTDRGWEYESAIYIKTERLELIECGRVDLQMPEVDRGLFWARLQTKQCTPLFVGTVHLTHQLNQDEVDTGVGYRHKQAHTAALALNELVGSTAALLCGDFNDPIHPARIFQEVSGFIDIFSALGLVAPLTFPCPYLCEENYLAEAIDKIMYRGAVKPVLATSPQYHRPAAVLSDHWPVAAVVALDSVDTCVEER